MPDNNHADDIITVPQVDCYCGVKAERAHDELMYSCVVGSLLVCLIILGIAVIYVRMQRFNDHMFMRSKARELQAEHDQSIANLRKLAERIKSEYPTSQNIRSRSTRPEPELEDFTDE